MLIKKKEKKKVQIYFIISKNNMQTQYLQSCTVVSSSNNYLKWLKKSLIVHENSFKVIIPALELISNVFSKISIILLIYNNFHKIHKESTKTMTWSSTFKKLTAK